LRGRISIDKLKIGDEVFGFDHRLETIVKTKIINIFSREASVNEFVRIQFDKGCPNFLYITENHEIYIKGKGYIRADQIKPGDIVYDTVDGKLVYNRMTKHNPMFDSETVKKVVQTQTAAGHYIANGNRARGIKRNLDDYPKLKDYVLNRNAMKRPEVSKKNAESHFRKPSKLEQKYAEILSPYPIRFVGNNKLAIGDKKHGYIFPDFKINGEKKVIEIYYSTFPFYKYKGKLITRDTQWEQERTEHLAQFGYKVMFLTELDLVSQDLLNKVADFVYNGKTVVEVRKELKAKEKPRIGGRFSGDHRKSNDPVMVYNLETETHNYFAETVLVHNCDSKNTWGTGKFGDKQLPTSLYQLKEQVNAFKPVREICITGGEPMLEGNGEFLRTFIWDMHYNGYSFTIETAATIYNTKIVKSPINMWSLSPKYPCQMTGYVDWVNYSVLNAMVEKISPSAMEFKLLISNERDLEEAKKLLKAISPQAFNKLVNNRIPVIVQPDCESNWTTESFNPELQQGFKTTAKETPSTSDYMKVLQTISRALISDPFISQFNLQILPQYHKLIGVV
jgi:organic radical activating enzyme